MAFRIKTITDADEPRARVTMEETDAQGNPIPGRVWSENFDTKKKDWPGLNKRFKDRIDLDDAKKAASDTLIDEGNNAGLTSINS